jgi:probable rRNA maturation factor
MEETFSLANKTRSAPPALPYKLIKEAVLGKKYSLSVVFVGHRTSRRLNLTYRNKDKPTNVLSFPLSEDSGEIYLDLAKAKTELKLFETNFKKHVAHLFIHGLLHLKGLDHGSTMENKELQYMKHFGV